MTGDSKKMNDDVMVKCRICEEIFESMRIFVELQDDGWDVCDFCDYDDENGDDF